MRSQDINFARLYARFRSGKFFLITLVAFIAASITAHWLFGYDRDWTVTNLFLSIEASVAVTALIMDGQKSDKARSDQSRYILHLLESHSALLKALLGKRNEQ